MKAAAVLPPFVVLSILCVCFGSAQVEVSQPGGDEQEAPFNFDAMSFAIANSPRSRLDLYVQVPYENLSFVKQSDRYAASYETSIDLTDSAGSLVNEKVWTEEVNAATFDETTASEAYSLTQRIFELAPGRYNIVVTVRDLETKVGRRVAKQFLISDYQSSPFSLSDIMLVSKLSMTGGKKMIVPDVSQNVGNLPGPFYVFFEAYSRKQNDTVRFLATVYDEKNQPMLQVDTPQVLTPPRSQVFMKIDGSNLGLGNYRLVVRAYEERFVPGQEEPSLASTNRLFDIHWRGMPRGLKDLDVAIEQLEYIAKDNELSYIKDAKSLEEKQKRFLEFWKKRDPNPNTPRNEKMEQYYAKVEYANKHFKHYIEGWRTDMGMVYIIFGPPNNVDRHPFDIDAKPYEVWSYYDLNHQFIFVDQTGFGDYRLITPIWEVWQRPRD